MLSPADYAIRAFGGVYQLAKAIGRTRQAVNKWRHPTERGGCGGKVPVKSQELILTRAKELGLDLNGDDLILGRATER